MNQTIDGTVRVLLTETQQEPVLVFFEKFIKPVAGNNKVVVLVFFDVIFHRTPTGLAIFGNQPLGYFWVLFSDEGFWWIKVHEKVTAVIEAGVNEAGYVQSPVCLFV
jgi:hypothetical protein